MLIVKVNSNSNKKIQVKVKLIVTMIINVIVIVVVTLIVVLLVKIIFKVIIVVKRKNQVQTRRNRFFFNSVQLLFIQQYLCERFFAARINLFVVQHCTTLLPLTTEIP